MLRRAPIIVAFIAALPLMLVVAEVTTRFDDWLRYGMPFMASADESEDLQIVDTLGVRGRPHGRHLRYHLDNYGFRSAQDVSIARRAGCTRIMTLGASETFGASEPDGLEYPAQLARRLGKTGCTEVLNAGVPGMTLPQIRYTWTHYWYQFAPDYVLIYPTPVFYLANRRPIGPRPEFLKRRSPPRPALRPRLMFLAREALSYPAVIQRRRVQRFTRNGLEGIPEDSLWRTVPKQRLGMFVADLDSLTSEVLQAGSKPVLMTHAIRFGSTPDPADADILAAWRQFTPRALPDVMIAFETSAAEETRSLALARKLPLADVACILSGERTRFTDFVHFTAEGAAVVAAVAEQAIAHERHEPLGQTGAIRETPCSPLPEAVASRTSDGTTF